MKQVRKNGTGRLLRGILSLVLVLAMLLSVVPGGLGVLKVRAAGEDVNIRIHFYSEPTWNWSSVALQYWGGSSTEVSGHQSGPTEIPGWGGAQGYVLTPEGESWYTITLKGDFEGFQFLDMDNPGSNTGGKGYSSYMSQFTGETPKDLYCKYNADTGYNAKWFTDKACTQELQAPAEAKTYTATIHYRNTDGWATVNTKFGEGNSWAAIPGYENYKNSEFGDAMPADENNAGWYTVTVAKTNDSAINGLFNDGSWGEGHQYGNWTTGTLTGDQEFWFVDGAMTETAPEGWSTGKAAVDYYLIGYINGADYGCGADSANLGDYKFVDGKVTAKFDETSYVYVKTGDNNKWFMTDGWLGNVTEATLYDSAALDDTANKLMVPGEEELTFTLVENADGTLTLSYEVNGAEDAPAFAFPVVDGMIKVGDLVQVKVGATVYDMAVYGSGVYEVTASVTGDATAELYVNGEAIGKTCQITGAEGDTVIRLTNAATVEAMKLETVDVGYAALVGTLTSITGGAVDEWNPADADARLDYLGGGLYGKTIPVTVEADASVRYKVAFDGTWAYNIGDTGYNTDDRAVTIPAGTTGITILVDKINNVFYDSVTAGNLTIPQNSGNLKSPTLSTSVSIIGTVRGGNNDWVATAEGWDFEQLSNGVFRYQMDLAAGNYNYKCVFNHAKWYEKEGDQSLKLAEDTHVVFVYDAATGYLYDSVTDPDAVSRLMGMTARYQLLDNRDGTLRFFVPDAGYDSVTLYYAEKADVEAGIAIERADMTESAFGGWFATIDVGDGPVDLVFQYKYDDGEITTCDEFDTVTLGETLFNHFTRDALPTAEAFVPGTFPGESWNPASNKMTYLGNGLYTYTFKDVPAANYEFKIAMNGSWDENYGRGGVKNSPSDNYSVTVPYTQDVTVYFSYISKLAVTSVNYIFADIDLVGTGIPAGTKLTDNGLTTIYSVALELEPGTYDDVKIQYNGKDYPFKPFTLDKKTTVTFYMDPVTEIYYCDAPGAELVADLIYYNSRLEDYKSPYGAVAAGEEVTFSIDTCPNANAVYLVTKGANQKKVEFAKAGEVKDGIQKWSATTSFDEIGESDYYFVIYNDNTALVYGDDDGFYGEGKVTNLADVLPYDLIVYAADFTTPDWMKNAVVYQIFPDRFYDGDASNNQAQLSARGEVGYEFIGDWYTLPENPEQEGNAGYPANAHNGDGNWSNEIYGGDLQGIIDRMDYLKALGVNVIYLNPVFSSISSHRYDACDYTKIDPILGTEGDFAALVAAAEANGMHIILDGVFNHVSDDSVYFDRYYKFLGQSEKIGAYPYWAYVYDYMADNDVDQATAEAAAKTYFTANYGITDYSYTEWFEVYNSAMGDGETVVADGIGLRAGKPVYSYDGWWGYDSMPIIYATNGSEYQTGNWAEEIIYNEDGTSVSQYWISKGSDGWRLDVANEVSNETWQHFRASVKAMDSDAVIVGEIWDDATKYILGDMYDSVMNYMFRGAVTGFAMGTSAEDTTKQMEKLRERYPEEAFYAMMNLVGSHDTTRILSYLDGIPDDRSGATMDTAFPSYENTSETAKRRQYLVSFLQFTYAGAPTIYYGDEIGMVGADDPDDRRAMEWGKGNQDLVEWYAKLAAIRSAYPALRTGSVAPIDIESRNVMGFVRKDADNTVIVLANNSDSAMPVTVNLDDIGAEYGVYVDLVQGGASVLATGTDLDGTNGVFTAVVPGYGGLILVKQDAVKDITVDYDALAPAYDEGYIVPERHMHDYQVTEVVAPTCTEDGYTLYTCADEDCGETTKQNIVKALGHQWGEWETTKEATAAADGEKRRDCQRCDAYETQVIPATGTPGTEPTEETKPAEKPNQPATGDQTPVAALAAVLMLSVLGCTALVFTRKKWMKK